MKISRFAFDNYISRVLSDTTSGFLKQIGTLIKQKLLYCVDITILCERYNSDFFVETFKRIPVSAMNNDVPVQYSYVISPLINTWDVVKFRGTNIFVNVNASSECTGTKVVMLYCVNTEYARNSLNLFVKHIKKFAPKTVYNENIYGTIEHRNIDFHCGKSTRTFKDVFITNDIKKGITESISGFLKNKKWYTDHKIPYHYGILLYGPPGTGKSSIISSLSMEYKLIPCYIDPSNIGSLLAYKEDLKDNLSDETVKLFIIEDVDSCNFLVKNDNEYPDDPNRKRTYSDDRSSHMSDFLNLMDGTKALQNIIWVFTTNHIDKIEPSLIRPGRIDKKFHIDYANNETFNQFLIYHFNKPVPLGFKVAENVSFAEVQDDVMLGRTYQEVIDKYSVK